MLFYVCSYKPGVMMRMMTMVAIAQILNQGIFLMLMTMVILLTFMGLTMSMDHLNCIIIEIALRH